MKILLLTPWYPDQKSQNSGSFIRSQATAIASTHDVVVISSKINYAEFSVCKYHVKESLYNNVKEYRCLVNRSLPVYNQLNYLWCTILFTRKVINSFKPDIIHSSIGYPGGIWGFVVAVLSKKPFIFTEHTRVINNFRSVFHKALTLFGIKRADCCITVSTALATEIKLYINKPVQVVPNVVEVDRFTLLELPVRDELQIGFLGGMNTPVKGLDILLQALAKVEHKVMLHIGGTGVLEDHYKKLAVSLGLNGRCKFYGFIPYEEVPVFFRNVNFMVCSSRYETFNVTLGEAMASGLPVVSTRCGGPEDFVNDTNGILVEVDSVDKLADGINQMIRRIHTFDKKSIRKFAVANFSPQQYVLRISKIYHDHIKAV